MVIEPQAFYTLFGGAIVTLIGAFAVWIKSRANASEYQDKARADGYTVQEKSRSDATATLADIAKAGNFYQQKMIEVVQENTRVNAEGAARLQGMTMMMDDYNRVLKNVVVGFDDVSGQLPGLKSSVDRTHGMIDTLETNLINDQFGPVVDELKDIGARITETNNLVTGLIEEFRGVEQRLLKALEPAAIAEAERIRSTNTHPTVQLPEPTKEETPTL